MGKPITNSMASTKTSKSYTQDEKLLPWQIHSRRLLTECLSNPGTGVLRVPFVLLHNTLREVAQRATQINDIQLNELMMRLCLYAVSDPEDKEYDQKFVTAYRKKAMREKRKQKLQREKREREALRAEQKQNNDKNT